jgi:hypothetical protein
LIDWSSPTLKSVLSYDVGRFPFAEVVASILDVETLSTVGRDSGYDLLSRERDQQTAFHECFYRSVDSFLPLYRRFLVEYVNPLVAEEIVFQRVPTFRVHLPENVAVGTFHVDSDFGHGPGEVNLWLPFTDAWDTNAVWIESAPGLGDYQPAAVRYGEVLVFSGVGLRHGNRLNTTGHTRVSVDFRVLRRSEYRPRDDASVNAGLRFRIGEYFAEL